MDEKLSRVAESYLERYYGILERMISGMTGAELTDSVSHNFIVQMIPHHEAAIEMSESLLRYTTCLPLQGIAEGIITEQTKSIEDMRAILAPCGEQASKPEALQCYQERFQKISQAMFARMRGACEANNINISFMREMMPHHEGAIRMAENALRYPLCEGLPPILRAIITSQRKGVREMERLLRAV